MALPILIADDSSMSRKMIIKALPTGWDVEISEAANGKEALEGYRAGKADVMFLDLTMPVMDGYQVLETLKSEDLNTFVIVISADIQDKAQEKVKSLGAVAFIQKPVKAETIAAVLKEHGIL